MNNQSRQSCPRVMTKEQVQLVHDKTLELLETIGVWVQSGDALKILKETGCDVRNPKRVRIPRRLVEKAIQTAPKNIDVYDRNGRLAMTLQASKCYYGTGSDCTHHIDLYTGKRRNTTNQDVRNLVRFCDALPNIDFIMSMGIAYDAPRGCEFVHQYEAMLSHTTKPVIVTGNGRNDMKSMVKMAAEVVGGPDKLSKRPPLILYSEPFSPLTHTEMGVSKCLVCGKYGIPFIYIPSPMMGGTGPVTYAGNLVQANAECLSGLVIFQTAYPGAKFIYGADATSMDMRQAVYTYGSPELNVFNMALADLAHYYRLPFFCISGSTDSKITDAQAGIEYALSLYTATLNGCNLIHDCGYLESGRTSSFESILMADEIISMLKHMLQPLDITEETIALKVIDEVGPGNVYLTHHHTLKNFRKNVWQPRFFDRAVFENWAKQGAEDLRQRLNREAKRLFAGHQSPALPPAVATKIGRIVRDHTPDS